MSEVVWTRSAAADVKGIHRYISGFNPYAADLLVDKIFEAGNGLANFPHRGREVRGDFLREIPLPYPYIIRYRILGERVIILRVRHGKRQQ